MNSITPTALRVANPQGLFVQEPSASAPRYIPCRERGPSHIDALLGQVACQSIMAQFPLNLGMVCPVDGRKTRAAACKKAVDALTPPLPRLTRPGWFKTHQVTALLYGHAVVLGTAPNSCWSARVKGEQFALASRPGASSDLMQREIISRGLMEAFGPRSFYSVGIAPLADGEEYVIHGVGALHDVDRERCLMALARLFGTTPGELAVGSSEDLLHAASMYFQNNGSDRDRLGLGGMYASHRVMREARRLYEQDFRMLSGLFETRLVEAPGLARAA